MFRSFSYFCISSHIILCYKQIDGTFIVGNFLSCNVIYLYIICENIGNVTGKMVKNVVALLLPRKIFWRESI